jgi:hypothetical protein
MRSTLPEELAARSKERSADGDETSAPSTMKMTPLAGMPRIEAETAVWGPEMMEMPGVYFRYSPMLPSPRSPISSSTITFLMLGDIFCSLIAAAAAFIAVDSTTKALERHDVLFAQGATPSDRASSKSFRPTPPGVTVIGGRLRFHARIDHLEADLARGHAGQTKFTVAVRQGLQPRSFHQHAGVVEVGACIGIEHTPFDPARFRLGGGGHAERRRATPRGSEPEGRRAAGRTGWPGTTSGGTSWGGRA